jgi:hypothetical protein
MKRPKKLTAQQKRLNDIRKCTCCKRILLEKYFDYFPLNNPEKVKSCSFCFKERVEKHKEYRPNTDPMKDTKSCTTCGKEKLVCLFTFRNPGANIPGGFCGWCLECNGKKAKAWQNSAPKKTRERIQRVKNEKLKTNYYRHRGTPRRRAQSLRQNAGAANVQIKGIDRHTIARDLQQGQRCGLSGEKLPLSRPTATFLDRGKTRGKIRGGDYSPENTIYAIPGFNCMRGLLDLNVEETRALLKEMKADNLELYSEIRKCVYASDVALLIPEIVDWLGEI